MTRDEILAFINANPICYLATVDGGKPRVRGMMMYKADNKGLWFHSGGMKAMIRQMQATSYVEVCFFNPQEQIQVRISGTVEFIDDLAVKQAMVAERPFLQPIIDKVGFDQFIVFVIEHCDAAVWTMAESMQPTKWVRL
jgi:uncharacterized pyridoxamine 5'-phosphate oxidase family protein